MASTDDAITTPSEEATQQDFESARSSLANDNDNELTDAKQNVGTSQQTESPSSIIGSETNGEEIDDHEDDRESLAMNGDENDNDNDEDHDDEVANIDEVGLLPIGRGIAISKQLKRTHKDKRIYLDNRTGLPVRPPSSFGLFKHALRRKMGEAKVDFKEFNAKAIVEWRKLAPSAKECYAQRSRLLTSQFKKIEVACLRKRVRHLQRANREIIRASSRRYY